MRVWGANDCFEAESMERNHTFLWEIRLSRMEAQWEASESEDQNGGACPGYDHDPAKRQNQEACGVGLSMQLRGIVLGVE